MSQSGELVPAAAAQGRYVRLRRLGAGGSGIVHEAYDRERQCRVALKTLRKTDGEAIFRLKREFRQLAELGHPNIARLFDLTLHDGDWFYTMELVEGVDFVSYCARAGATGGTFDDGRVRSALRQLATGLSVLHASGKVHRDVKPSNVLVTQSGRVVLLDFGLVAEVGERDATVSSELAGTVLYMAPEQLDLGEEPRPAWDWYALGTMLYQVLAGRPPFDGTRSEIARAKRERLAPTLDGEPAVPADLCRLCEGLLHRDSLRRLGQREVLAASSRGAVSRVTSVEPRQDGRAPFGFVGRERELAVLASLSDTVVSGQPAAVLVHGESGIGKTALIEEYTRRLREGSKAVTVLRGRCLDRESIPFRAIDGLIDQLSQHWRRLPATEAAYLLPREPHLLPHIFPVLGRVPAVTATPDRVEPSSAQDRRLRALGALREVLHRLAARTLTVLVLDDVQWMDADTLALLRYVVHPPDPPPVLWLLASRVDADRGLPQDRLLAEVQPTPRTLELGPLDTKDAERLARARLGAHSSALAASIAEESAGNPFLLDLLAHRATVFQGTDARLCVESALAQELLELSLGERVLLEVTCLAGEPLPERTATQAALLEGEQAGLAVMTLVGRRLLRRGGQQESDALEPYHDRIREAVVSGVPKAEVRRRFLGLAQSLASVGGARHELLARAWFGAGDVERAISHARSAADLAVKALAFEHGARLYERCLELGIADPGERHSVRKLAAEALANAGRGAEAAEHYLEAAKGSTKEESEVLVYQAAVQLLSSGQIDLGIATMAPLLAARGLGMPASWGEAIRLHLTTFLWLAIRHPGWRFKRRAPSSIRRDQLRQVDLCWGVFGAMVNGSLQHAVAYHARHLRLALAAGDPTRIVAALGSEAQRQACMTHDLAGPRRVIAAAFAIADREGDEQLHTTVEAWAVGCAFLTGRPAEALDRQILAEQALKEQGLAFQVETKSASLILNSSLYHAGMLRELRSRAEVGLADAQQRGDLFAIASCGSGFASSLRLASDDPQGAVAPAEDHIRRWANWDYFLQHFLLLFARVQSSLYRGDPVSASRLVVADDRPHRLSGLDRVGIQRILYADLAGRAAAAERAETGRVSEDLSRCLHSYRRQLPRLRSPWSRATSLMLDAQDTVVDAPDRAPEAMSRAIAAYDAAGMRMHAEACRYAHGKLVKGDEGRAAMARAVDFFREQTVRVPEKFIAMLLPVVRSLD